MPRPPSVTQEVVHETYQALIDEGMADANITAAAIQARVGGRWNRVVELLDRVRAGRGVADLPDDELEEELRREIETYSSKLVKRIRAFEMDRANAAVVDAEERVEQAEHALETERVRAEGLQTTIRPLEGQLADRDGRQDDLEFQLREQEKARAEELASLRAQHREQVDSITAEVEALRGVITALNANFVESIESGREDFESHSSRIISELAELRSQLAARAEAENPSPMIEMK